MSLKYHTKFTDDIEYTQQALCAMLLNYTNSVNRELLNSRNRLIGCELQLQKVSSELAFANSFRSGRIPSHNSRSDELHRNDSEDKEDKKVVIYGLVFPKRENPLFTVIKAISLIDDRIKICKVKLLRRSKTHNNCPVLVTLATRADKRLLFRNCHRLKDIKNSFSVTDYLSKDELSVRKAASAVIRQAKAEGKKVKVKKSEIFIDNNRLKSASTNTEYVQKAGKGHRERSKESQLMATAGDSEVEVHCEALPGYLYHEEINSEDDIVDSNAASSDDSHDCHSTDEKDDSSSEENTVESRVSPPEESSNDDTEEDWITEMQEIQEMEEYHEQVMNSTLRTLKIQSIIDPITKFVKEHEFRTDLHMEIIAEMDAVWARNKKKANHHCICEMNRNCNMNDIVHRLRKEIVDLGICIKLIQLIKDHFKAVAELCNARYRHEFKSCFCSNIDMYDNDIMTMQP